MAWGLLLAAAGFVLVWQGSGRTLTPGMSVQDTPISVLLDGPLPLDLASSAAVNASGDRSDLTVTPLPAPRFRINRHRWLAWIGSGLACLLSVIGLVLCWLHPSIRSPLKPGLDFTGGTQIQVVRACPGAGVNDPCAPLTAPDIQKQLGSLKLVAPAGEQPPNLGSASVQLLDRGRSLVLRLPALSADQATAVIQSLENAVGPLKSTGTSVETIGPTLGSRLLDRKSTRLNSSHSSVSRMPSSA